MRIRAALAAIAAVAAVFAVPAFAHAPVLGTFPKKNATVTTVRTVSVRFGEAVLTGKVGVRRADGSAVAVSASGLTNGKKRLRAAFSKNLAAGKYTVSWRVKADDGDTETGTVALPCAEHRFLPWVVMRVRDRFLLCAMPAAVLAAAVAHGAAGIPADALIAVPALLLLLPLVAGRYVGSERLVRLARRVPRPRLPRGARAVVRRRPALRPAPRGGLLIAVSLARRGPPASAAAR